MQASIFTKSRKLLKCSTFQLLGLPAWTRQRLPHRRPVRLASQNCCQATRPQYPGQLGQHRGVQAAVGVQRTKLLPKRKVREHLWQKKKCYLKISLSQSTSDFGNGDLLLSGLKSTQIKILPIYSEAPCPRSPWPTAVPPALLHQPAAAEVRGHCWCSPERGLPRSQQPAAADQGPGRTQ